MKLLHIAVHFEYAEEMGRILDRHEIVAAVRYPMMEGRDTAGRHEGTQAHPGSITVVQAQVPDDKVEPMFEDLRAFRDEKPAHRHLEVLVLPVEQRMT